MDDSELATGVYTCIVYCDRLLHPVVEQFTAELDPSDPRWLEATLAAAIRRDRGDWADPAPYSMDVYDQRGYLIVERYRPTSWPTLAIASSGAVPMLGPNE